MRALKKSLLSLTISTALLALGAGSAFAAAPVVEFTGSNGTATTIQVSGEVAPQGLDFSFHLEYFPQDVTTNCNFPAIEDLAAAQSTTAIPSSDHSPVVPVSATVTGLSYETEYCVRLVAENVDGEDESLFWGETTRSIPPTLDSHSFDNGSTSISYEGALTPNTNTYFGFIQAEYFAKTAAACEDYTGTVTELQYYNDDFDGWTGFTSQSFASQISGLQTDTTYCVRLVAYSPYANDPSDWSEVTTVQPRSISIANVKLGPTIGSDQAELTFDLDDRGAAADIGSSNNYDLMVHDVGVGRCTPADYYGGPELLDFSNIEFDGAISEAIGLSGLTSGKPYCVALFTESAWGSEYDTTTFTEVWFGEDPEVFSPITVDAPDYDSIEFAFPVNPGHLATTYGADFFVKQSGVLCSADTTSIRQSVTAGTITTDLGNTRALEFSIDELVGDTTYCITPFVKNYWGQQVGGSYTVLTPIQPIPATITNIAVGSNGGSVNSVEITADLDDSRAAEATGESGSYELGVYQVGASSCNDAGVAGQTPVDSDSDSFVGATEVVEIMGGLTVGTTYCIRLDALSSWDGMDARAYKSFVMPTGPSISAVSTSVTPTTATITGTRAATWSTAAYAAEYYSMTGSGACTGSATTVVTGLEVLSEAQAASASPVSFTITGLDPEQVICVRLVSESAFGGFAGDWLKATMPEVTPPSVPTGLASSAVTKTSALLSWTASTDNFGVDHYEVEADGSPLSSTAATSLSVTLECGVGKSFTVSAVDAAGNESAKSAAFVITGAACDVPPRNDGGNAETKTCLSTPAKSFTSKNAKGGKFKLKLSSGVGPNGQGLRISYKLTGKKPSPKPYFTVDGKKQKGSTITITKMSKVTVTFQFKKKSKTVKVAISQKVC